MNELVSVIIPVYNTEKYVQQCIESVLNQTYSNIEIIIIDDASTDNSLEMCMKYKEEKSVKIISRENKGLSLTRQEGIDIAQGTYFCNLDADDMLDTFFVEKMVSILQENQADVATCGRLDFDEEYRCPQTLSATKKIYELNQDIVAEEFHKLHDELWLADSWNKMYRTEFVRNSRVKYWLNNKYNGTDLSFNHLLILHSPKVVVLNEPLLLHRIVLGSRVHRKNKPLQEGFEIIAEKTILEAQKMNLSNKWYQSYGIVYTRLMVMVFDTFVRESETYQEFKSRFEDYRVRMKKFEDIHPELCLFKTKKNMNSLRAKFHLECATGNSYLKSLMYFMWVKQKSYGERNE